MWWVVLSALFLTMLPASASAQRSPVILSTTTSTQDSGLLDVLVPLFEQKTGYTVKTIAVGTGQALALAARGEADVVLAHAPSLEKKYVADGKMLDRRLVMHNDFVIIGPADDPAKIKGMKKAADAMKAYTLTDRGTYLAFQKRVRLPILVEGDKPLLNIYSVMRVNPSNGPRINSAGGAAFAEFVLSPETQAVIKTFGVEKYGQPLFVPVAGASEAEIGGEN